MSADDSTAKVEAVPVSIPSSDAFTRERWAWLKQVVADSDLTPFTFRVAFVVADHLNREIRLSWPSQDRIAQVLGATRKGIQGALIQLAERGHVAVLPPTNRNQGNRYRLILLGSIEVDAVEHISNRSHEAVYHVTGGTHETLSHANDGMHEVPPHDTGCTHETASHGTHGTHEDHAHATHCSTVMPPTGGPNLLKEPIEVESESFLPPTKPKRRPSVPKAKTSDADFDELWRQVPKAVGRADARRAYDKIITSCAATHTELLAGMLRYASERQGQDPQYTKHPATWLNKGCWTDAPAQRHAAPGRHSSNLYDAFQEIIDCGSSPPRTRRRDYVGEALDEILDHARTSQDRRQHMSPTAAAYDLFLNPNKSTEPGR